MHIKLLKTNKWNMTGLKDGPFIEGKKDDVVECEGDYGQKMIDWKAAKSHNPTKKETAAKKEAASQPKAEKSDDKEKVDDAKAEPKKESLLDTIKKAVTSK